MVGTGKLLAAGHMTSCCPAYKNGRPPSSTPLASDFLYRKDVFKEEGRRRVEKCVVSVLRRSRLYDTRISTNIALKIAFIRHYSVSMDIYTAL